MADIPTLPGLSREDLRDLKRMKKIAMDVLGRHDEDGGAASDRMRWYASFIVMTLYAAATGDEGGKLQEAMGVVAEHGLPEHPYVA